MSNESDRNGGIMNIGDMRITTQIHPDSINVRIWEAQEYRRRDGKYAKSGQCYWANARLANNGPIEPFTSRDDAVEYALSINPKADLDS